MRALPPKWGLLVDEVAISGVFKGKRRRVPAKLSVTKSTPEIHLHFGDQITVDLRLCTVI